MGGFADDWMTHLHLIDQLVRFPNVYADTSGVRYWEVLVRAVRRAGPGKLLFGSDGPRSIRLRTLQDQLLRLSPVDEARVTGGTILRLFGDPSPAPSHSNRADRQYLVRTPSRR